jgi:hypothetical protein
MKFAETLATGWKQNVNADISPNIALPGAANEISGSVRLDSLVRSENEGHSAAEFE